MKRRLFTALSALLLAILSVTVLYGCSPAAEETVPLKEPVAEKVGPIRVLRGDLRDTESRDAFLVPLELELSLPVSGIVDELPFMTGDHVKKGDLLLKLDTYQTEQEIAGLQREIEDLTRDASYEARLYELDIAYQDRQIAAFYQQGAGWQQVRLAQLEKEGLTLTHEEYLREYERKLSEKQEALKEKQALFEDSFLYAPADGIIYYTDGGYQEGVGVSVTEGASVEKDTTLVYLADETKKHIELDESLTADLRNLPCYAIYQGEEIEIEADPLSTEERTRIALLERKDKVRYRIMKRSLTDLPCGAYMPVYYVRASYEDVLYVPMNAVYHDSELSEDYVLRMNGDGGYERVRVDCVRCGVYMVIQSGIREGDELHVVR